MGLRPSVKKECSSNDSNNSSALLNSQNNHDKSSDKDKGDHNSSSSSESYTASSPAEAPQREAWTARGQLLLNFHHAISRAINSPEMAIKCSKIAVDMSRSEQRDIKTSSQPSSPSKPSIQGTNSRTAAELKSHSSIAEEYSAEAALIVENKAKRDALVRNKSLALGIFSFVALRSGRGLSTLLRKAIANSRAGGSSYQFEKHLTPATTSAKNRIGESTVALNQPSKLRRFFRVALDATIATSITFLSGAFLFIPRPAAYIEDMSKLPLVEGKSVYAEIVCPPLLKEYRRVLEQYGGQWPVHGYTSDVEGRSKARGDDMSSSQLTQEDVSLNIIRSFVENCSKRSKYEQALLEERNALNFDSPQSTYWTRKNNDRSKATGDNCSERGNKLGTVSIPSPGVPGDIPVNLDQDIFSLVPGDNDDKEEESGNNSKR